MAGGNDAAAPRTDGGADDAARAAMDAAPVALQTAVHIVQLDTPLVIPNEPKVEGTMTVYDRPPALFSAPLPLVQDLAMTPVTFTSPMGIELRGRSTRTYLKKPYAVELWDAMKESRAASVFGMPKESDFALLACWLDRTCLRTALGFQLANELKTPFAGGVMWAPKLELIEVFVNGVYDGTYNWVERVKRDKSRVNIPLPAADTASGDVTGGYMLRIEGTGKGSLVVGGKTYPRDFTISPSQQVWTYFYPRADEITAPQKAYVKDWVTRFEAACNGADREDPEKGYRKLIDMRSWVDYFLVRELGREVDSYRLSFYMVKLPDGMGGKLHAGPQWDFDRAFGNASYFDANKPTGGWSFEGVRSPGADAAMFAKNIFLSPAFQKEAACRWKEIRKSVVTTTNINAHLDRWDALWARSQERDEARYKPIGKTEGGIPTFKAYKPALADLKTWNEQRIAWMDSQLNPKCP